MSEIHHICELSIHFHPHLKPWGFCLPAGSTGAYFLSHTPPVSGPGRGADVLLSPQCHFQTLLPASSLKSPTFESNANKIKHSPASVQLSSSDPQFTPSPDFLTTLAPGSQSLYLIFLAWLLLISTCTHWVLPTPGFSVPWPPLTTFTFLTFSPICFPWLTLILPQWLLANSWTGTLPPQDFCPVAPSA